MIPLDIHTHHYPPTQGSAIINTYPSPDKIYQVHQHYSVGIHPWYCPLNEKELEQQLEIIDGLLHKEYIVAIGEIGLDKMAQTPMCQQQKVFERQIALAEKYQKPIIIHLVKELDLLIRIKRQFAISVPCIIHGFRGKPQQAKQLIQQGFQLSFGANYNVETLQYIPLNYLFTESDDSNITFEHIFKKIAEDKGIEAERFKEIIEQNVKNTFFSK